MKVLKLAAAAALMANMSSAGTLVAFGDEWITSNAAYPSTDGTRTLINNLVRMLGGSSYLVTGSPYNPYLYGSTFHSQLRDDLGKTVTVVSTEQQFLDSYNSADVLFLGGTIGAGADHTARINQFIEDGGSVVISLGTGVVDARGEAASWSGVLNAHGLSARTAWGPHTGVFNLTVADTDSALDDGVGSILWGYGNYITRFGDAQDAQLIGEGSFGTGFAAIGIAGEPSGQVPLPAGMPLLLAGLGALAVARRRR